jgi:hypothetical protein
MLIISLYQNPEFGFKAIKQSFCQDFWALRNTFLSIFFVHVCLHQKYNYITRI